MDTEQLISRIVEDGAQKPLPHPMKQTLFWLAGTVLYLVGLSSFNGLRADIADKLSEPLYLVEIMLLFLVAGAAALAAFCLSRPDGHQMPRVKYVPFVFLAAWAVTAFGGADGISWADLFQSIKLGQLDCPRHILMFSVPPGVAIFLIVKKGAPIRCCWAGSMATLSVTAFAYLCMRFIEPTDNPAHLIIWHALPIALMCIVGMAVGKYALRWR